MADTEEIQGADGTPPGNQVNPEDLVTTPPEDGAEAGGGAGAGQGQAQLEPEQGDGQGKVVSTVGIM